MRLKRLAERGAGLNGFIFLTVIGLLVLGACDAFVLPYPANLNVPEILTYSVEDCPAGSGWVSRNSETTYKGRTIKGTTTSVGVAVESNFMQLTNGLNPTHTHATASGVSYTAGPTTMPTVRVDCDATLNTATNAAQSSTTIKGNSFTSTVASGEFYPSTYLTLCSYYAQEGAAQYYLPKGAVFFMGASMTSCPAGSQTLNDALGRLIVFASSTRTVSTTDPVVSLANTAGDNEGIGLHTHVHPTSVSLGVKTSTSLLATKSPTTCSASTGLFPMATSSPTITMTKASDGAAASLGIPYVGLIPCVVTDDSGSEYSRPPRSLLFFHVNNDCADGWEDSTKRTDGPTLNPNAFQNLPGRVIFTKPATIAGNQYNGVKIGRAAPLNQAASNAPTPSNHDSHYHSFQGSVKLSALSCGGSNNCSTPNNIVTTDTGSTYSFNSGVDASDLIPFIALRGCSPIVTSRPTLSPTDRPSNSPSVAPSKSPTTARPSKAPSVSPTTPKPTKKPSQSPTTARPSTSPTQSPSPEPTTSEPSGVPSSTSDAPTASPTSLPSAAPSSMPTTSEPTLSPSKFDLSICQSNSSLSAVQCQTMVLSQCSAQGIAMKYAGLGCKDKFGKSLKDGGCQCSGYCNYKCSQACIADAQCRWATVKGKKFCMPKNKKAPVKTVLKCPKTA